MAPFLNCLSTFLPTIWNSESSSIEAKAEECICKLLSVNVLVGYLGATLAIRKLHHDKKLGLDSHSVART